MAMAEQQWPNNWNFRSEHAVSNPIMVPQMAASPRSIGEQSVLCQQMVENVLNSPGSLSHRDLKFFKANQQQQKSEKPKAPSDQTGNNNNQTDHTTPVEGLSPTNPVSGNEVVQPMAVPVAYSGSEMQQQVGPEYNQYPFVFPGQNPVLYTATSNQAPFGTSPTSFAYGLPRGTPPTSQMFSSSPPMFPLAYNNGPTMVQGLTGAMSQMNIGAGSGMPTRRESFGSTGPTQINGGPVRAFPPQMTQPGYFVIPNSPPISMGSSPNHVIYAPGVYPNASMAGAMNGPHGTVNGPSNGVYGMHPSRQMFNGPNASGPHYNNGHVPPPHIPQIPNHNRRNAPLQHNGPHGNRSQHMHIVPADADKSVIRSPLLEEFRNSRLPHLQLTELNGHVAEFSRDQHGSRFIQQKLERASLREKQLIFDEVIANASNLMTDVFGNYVCQKFFEHGTTEQKHQLISALKGNVMKLALHMYGCRILQKALECVEPDEQMELLKEMEGDVLKCVKDQNGNHVVQKIIERVDPNKLSFIIDAFMSEGPSTVTALSTHPYGCRVIQRVLEHCTEEQKRPILEQLHKNINTLIIDQYGNYVVQHVIERGSDEDRDRIINQIKGNLQRFSQHKFSSNVIEKCLIFGNNSHKTALITEACGDGTKTTPLLEMMQHEFGNFVCQKMLDVADSANRKKIMLAIKPHIPTLRNSYGRHILSKLEKYFQKQNGSSPFAQPVDYSSGVQLY
ncbi:hypothetical protein M3Y95_00469600 [Aphelenchoides besseyi]|nr:hypothetical protein M3Y95_00469600 [Aphelenchoides besseyi]